MTDDAFASLRIAVAAGIARMTIDHPPLKLLDATLLDDLERAGRALVADVPGGRRLRLTAPPLDASGRTTVPTLSRRRAG